MEDVKEHGCSPIKLAQSGEKIYHFVKNLLQTDNFVLGYIDSEGVHQICIGAIEASEFFALKGILEMQLMDQANEYFCYE